MNEDARIFTRSGLQTAVSAALAADRRRIAAIMGLAEAAGREQLALTIATTTDQSPDQAKASLAATPTAAATDTTTTSATNTAALWDRALSARGLPVQMPDTSNPPKLPDWAWH